MTILYSVIIPHYNDPERLERLLKSIPLNRNDIEAIVVDDCSPDQSSLNKVRLNWQGVKWISTSENLGAGVARNVGLDNAQGRWLLFGDSDDEFLPNTFEIFDNLVKNDDELVYFLAEAIQECNGNPSIRSERLNELVINYDRLRDDQSCRLLRLHHVVPVAKIYSRIFIQSNSLRFDPVRFSNDVAFNVLAAMQVSSLRVETVPVYKIYRRADSLTADLSANAFLARFLVLGSLAQRLDALGVYKAIPATGSMLLAVKYGPRMVIKVWWISLRSSLYIDWLRLVSFDRWKKFITKRKQSREEQSRF